MSKYKTIATEFKNIDSLRKALDDLGYNRDYIKVAEDPHQNTLPLYGYEGRRRPEMAALVIGRWDVGNAANDVGFFWTGKNYSLIVSEYDSGRNFTPARQEKLMQRYAYHEVVQKARRQGYQVREEVLADGTIQLQLTQN